MSIVLILLIVAVGLNGLISVKPTGWGVVALAAVALLLHLFGVAR